MEEFLLESINRLSLSINSNSSLVLKNSETLEKNSWFILGASKEVFGRGSSFVKYSEEMSHPFPFPPKIRVSDLREGGRLPAPFFQGRMKDRDWDSGLKEVNLQVIRAIGAASVCGFPVIDGEEDDLVVVDGATTATTLEGYWLQMEASSDAQRCMMDDSVVEIGRQRCWYDNDLAGARVKMVKIGGHDIARDRVGWWCENKGQIVFWVQFSGNDWQVQQKGDDALVVVRDALERTAVGRMAMTRAVKMVGLPVLTALAVTTLDDAAARVSWREIRGGDVAETFLNAPSNIFNVMIHFHREIINYPDLCPSPVLS
ncbi:hypothetical protein V8G54_000997 [Vigna mungo]|uniref:Uncharacterized protein n=1 Tax=Vigna mungo TaxID=3915 RepID=A0AAQ3P6G2_VIGMU